MKPMQRQQQRKVNQFIHATEAQPPKYFGQQYAGSSLKRKNDIRRKRLMKAS